MPGVLGTREFLEEKAVAKPHRELDVSCETKRQHEPRNDTVAGGLTSIGICKDRRRRQCNQRRRHGWESLFFECAHGCEIFVLEKRQKGVKENTENADEGAGGHEREQVDCRTSREEMRTGSTIGRNLG